MALMPATRVTVVAGGLMVIGYDDYQDSVTLVTTSLMEKPLPECQGLRVLRVASR
jgi:hypothetical protein